MDELIISSVRIKVLQDDISSAIQVSYDLPDTLPSERLSKTQIKELAKRHTLLESKEINPPLRFLVGIYRTGMSRD